MSRLAFIFRTDVHTSDKSPASWKGDYPAEIWSNLEQIGELAREHECTAVLDGGDYIHVKAATRNSHALVKRSADIQAGYPCDTYCVEGNHDLAYNNLDSIERQPLGVLYATGVFKHLREAFFMTTEGLKVQVVGFPYDPNRTLESITSITKSPDVDVLIMVVHQLAGKDPPDHIEDFYGEPVFRYEDLVYENGPDVVCFGHWHKDQGIEVIDGRHFVNQGAVSRGALVKENLERNPKVALIEVTEDGVKVSPIRLKVAPAEEVFDLEKKERRDKESQVIEEFVGLLNESTQVDAAGGIEASVQTLGFAPEVRTMALEYLERARE